MPGQHPTLDRQRDPGNERRLVRGEKGDGRSDLVRLTDPAERVHAGEPVRAALSDGGSPLVATCKQLIDTTERFLDAAQRSGHARADIRGRDLYVGALGAAWAAGMPSADGTTRESAPQLLRQGWQR